MLCRKHLASVMERLSRDKRTELIEHEKRKLENIKKRLTSLINKHDYRNKEPVTREEQQALPEAIEALRGREVSTNLCLATPRSRSSNTPLAFLLERLTKRSKR